MPYIGTGRISLLFEEAGSGGIPEDHRRTCGRLCISSLTTTGDHAKPALSRGTEGSNPSPSNGESSANPVGAGPVGFVRSAFKVLEHDLELAPVGPHLAARQSVAPDADLAAAS